MGAELVIHLLKACNTAIAATAIMVLLMYIPALVSGFRSTPRSRAWFLILGICLTWGGACATYGYLAALYWLAEQEPVLSHAPPLPIRFIWISLLLAGGAIHIAAAQRERLGVGRGFAVWTCSVLVFIAITTLLGS